MRRLPRALRRRCSACSTWWIRCPCRSAAADYGAAGVAAHRAPPAGPAPLVWRCPYAAGAGRRPARPSPCCWWRPSWPAASIRAARASRPRWPAADPQAGERVLLVAVGDYLERSQMVLIELANANPKGPLDISAEQERAGDLVSESRLYRQTAAHTGDTARGRRARRTRARAGGYYPRALRISTRRVGKTAPAAEAEGILFKIRVLGSNVRNQEDSGRNPLPAAPQQKL